MRSRRQASVSADLVTSDVQMRPLPLAELNGALSGTPVLGRVLPKGSHPLFTRYFDPPPTPPPPSPPEPPPPPPPPPPKLKKLLLTYQGLIKTSDARQQAFVQVDTNLVVLRQGDLVVGDWRIAELLPQTLALTNASSQTNILPFNSAREFQIPAD